MKLRNPFKRKKLVKQIPKTEEGHGASIRIYEEGGGNEESSSLWNSSIISDDDEDMEAIQVVPPQSRVYYEQEQNVHISRELRRKLSISSMRSSDLIDLRSSIRNAEQNRKKGGESLRSVERVGLLLTVPGRENSPVSTLSPRSSPRSARNSFSSNSPHIVYSPNPEILRDHIPIAEIIKGHGKHYQSTRRGEKGLYRSPNSTLERKKLSLPRFKNSTPPKQSTATIQSIDKILEDVESMILELDPESSKLAKRNSILRPVELANKAEGIVYEEILDNYIAHTEDVKKNVAKVAESVSKGTEAALRTTKAWFSRISGDYSESREDTNVDNGTGDNEKSSAKLKASPPRFESRLQQRLKEKVLAHEKVAPVKKTSEKNEKDLKQVDAQLELARLNTDQESLIPIISMVQALKNEDFSPDEYELLMQKIQASLKEMGVPEMEIEKADTAVVAITTAVDNDSRERLKVSPVEEDIVYAETEITEEDSTTASNDGLIANCVVVQDNSRVEVDIIPDGHQNDSICSIVVRNYADHATINSEGGSEVGILQASSQVATEAKNIDAKSIESQKHFIELEPDNSRQLPVASAEFLPLEEIHSTLNSPVEEIDSLPITGNDIGDMCSISTPIYCFKCQTPLLGEQRVEKINGNLFHRGCICCSVCKIPLDKFDNELSVIDEVAYCCIHYSESQLRTPLQTQDDGIKLLGNPVVDEPEQLPSPSSFAEESSVAVVGLKRNRYNPICSSANSTDDITATESIKTDGKSVNSPHEPFPAVLTRRVSTYRLSQNSAQECESLSSPPTSKVLVDRSNSNSYSSIGVLTRTRSQSSSLFPIYDEPSNIKSPITDNSAPAVYFPPIVPLKLDLQEFYIPASINSAPLCKLPEMEQSSDLSRPYSASAFDPRHIEYDYYGVQEEEESRLSHTKLKHRFDKVRKAPELSYTLNCVYEELSKLDAKDDKESLAKVYSALEAYKRERGFETGDDSLRLSISNNLSIALQKSLSPVKRSFTLFSKKRQPLAQQVPISTEAEETQFREAPNSKHKSLDLMSRLPTYRQLRLERLDLHEKADHSYNRKSIARDRDIENPHSDTQTPLKSGFFSKLAAKIINFQKIK